MEPRNKTNRERERNERFAQAVVKLPTPELVAQNDGQERMSIDLRYAVRDLGAGGGSWWSALTEQKFSIHLPTAEENARRVSGGKLLLAAKGGRFELGVAGGTPVTARAAACGALAVSADAWSFGVVPRTDWGGFPAGLRREPTPRLFPAAVRDLFPQEVRALLQKPSTAKSQPSLVAKAPLTPGKFPAPKKQAPAQAPNLKPHASKPAPASHGNQRVSKPAVQKNIAKAPKPGASGTAGKKARAKPATGGRNYQKRTHRKVKGKQSPKDRCAECTYRKVKTIAKRGARKGKQIEAWVCTKCNRTDRAPRYTPKFKVVRCTDLGKKCKRAPTTTGRCTVCKRGPLH